VPPPTIVCVNEATIPLGVSFDRLVRVLRSFVNEHLAPAWGSVVRVVSCARLADNDAGDVAGGDEVEEESGVIPG
jgi:hypothetical protein